MSSGRNDPYAKAETFEDLARQVGLDEPKVIDASYYMQNLDTKLFASNLYWPDWHRGCNEKIDCIELNLEKGCKSYRIERTAFVCG